MMHTPKLILQAVALSFLVLQMQPESASATQRVSTGSGNFSSPNSWSPAGVPASSDQITLATGHNLLMDVPVTVQSVNVQQGASLRFSNSSKLTLSGSFVVQGDVDLTGGDIDQTTPGALFSIGPAGTFTWQPTNNTAAGATLFTNSTENFSPTSNLIIKQWYNYSNVPLGSVVTGDFGNVTLNTLTGGLLYEWNQSNQFETHQVLGTLTVDQGWIVLDKSGQISQTTFGALVLKNVNAYLDFHSGSHPGTFKVITGSLTNIGGDLHGIYNGNGNVQLTVNGDFENLGNAVLIYNTGVQGVGNGNATLKVTGTFRQPTGDFRGIFNLTTQTAGHIDLEFGNIRFTGGVFMAQYACHTSGNRNTLKVHGNLEMDCSNSNSIFRCNGLSSLAGFTSNPDLQLTIEGNLSIHGPASAEFTSSGSSGQENCTVKGTTTFNGSNINFNYGNHDAYLEFDGTVTSVAGTVFLSRTNGQLTCIANEDFNIQSGTVSVSAGTGNCNLTIFGKLKITGGGILLHNNSATPTSHTIYVTVLGDYIQQGGIFTFDNNAASTTGHMLSLNGSLVSLSGTSVINSTTDPSNPATGIIYYDKSGILEYRQSGSPTIQSVKQVLHGGCTVQIKEGNFIGGTAPGNVPDMIRLHSQSVLDLETGKILVGASPGGSLLAEAGSRIRTSRIEGFSNDAGSGALPSASAFVRALDPASVVEYYGTESQNLTGAGTPNQAYGILEINKPGSIVRQQAASISIAGSLKLTEGLLHLNGNKISIRQGNSQSIVKNRGSLVCEINKNGKAGIVAFDQVDAAALSIPIANNSGETFECSIDITSGIGRPLTFSTWATTPDNLPYPAGINGIIYQGNEIATSKVIDRWYQFNGQGITANLRLGFAGSENTLHNPGSAADLSVLTWKNKWKNAGGNGIANPGQQGSVVVEGFVPDGICCLAYAGQFAAADLLTFDARKAGVTSQVTWTALSGNDAASYTVERSVDGKLFADLNTVAALGPVSDYAYDDRNPVRGINFYRLRQTDHSGKEKYSKVVAVDHGINGLEGFTLSGVSPNPFGENFQVTYRVDTRCQVMFELNSINGQRVFRKYADAEPGEQTTTLETPDNLVSGVYMLTVSDGKNQQYRKLFHY